MSPTRRRLVVVCLVLTSTTLVLTQSQTPPVFRAEANLVEVIVRVTDKEGRFIPGLTQADFALQEEGRAQTIVAFNSVDIPRHPVPLAGTVRHVLDAPVMSTVATNAGADEARLFVLVLDDVLSSTQLTVPIRRFARDFVERFVGPSDLMTVFSTGGLASRVQEATNDKTRTLATIDRFVGRRCRGSESDAERVYVGRVAADVIGAVADHYSAVRGRRVSLLWISEGIDEPQWRIFKDIEDPTLDPGTVVHSMNVAIRRLQRANVTVYAVDPRGLAPGGGSSRENPCGYGGGGKPSLERFSQETGGFAATAWNDYSPHFERILDENSQYYVLGYQTNRPGRENEIRRIRVRVVRPGLERAVVSARSSYTVSTPRPPEAGPPDMAPALVRTATSSLPSAGLPLRVQAVPREGPNGRGLVHVIVEVGSRDFQFAEKNGRFTERLEFSLLTVDQVARADNVRPFAMALDLTAAQAEEVRRSGIRWLTSVDLDPGRYSLRVATHALNTNRSGAVFVDVDVPQYRNNQLRIDGVALSSTLATPMLTSGGPAALGLPGPPTTARTFVKGDVITVGAEIGVRRDFTTGAIELTVHPQAAAPDAPPALSRTLELGDRTAAGQPQAFAVDTAALGAGPFILRLAVRDQEGRRAETAVLFDVVEPQTPSRVAR
jgi:VWFA-related protein